MKTLLLLRHAKSSWNNDGLDDHDRPLNNRGKNTAPIMGVLLAKQGLLPGLIISSTAMRARDTAALAAEAAGYQGKLRLEPRLYLAGPADITSVLNDLEKDSPDCVMVVCHNPGLESFISMYTGRDERFPTAALARIEFSVDRWEDIQLETECALKDLWRPKELKSSS